MVMDMRIRLMIKIIVRNSVVLRAMDMILV